MTNMLLYQIITILYMKKKIEKSYKNNKFEMLALAWNEEFELPDGSCYVFDIQDYFESILEKTWKKDW